jgi:hypothetical protein
MKQPSLIEAWELVYHKNSAMGFYDDDQIVTDYTNIIKHHKADLTLGDFIPCEDGKPLIDTETTMRQGDGQVYYGASDEEFEEYQQALDRVIYAGWRLDENDLSNCFTLTNEIYYLHFWENGDIEMECLGAEGVVDKKAIRNDMTGFELTETGSKIYK